MKSRKINFFVYTDPTLVFPKSACFNLISSNAFGRTKVVLVYFAVNKSFHDNFVVLMISNGITCREQIIGTLKENLTAKLDFLLHTKIINDYGYSRKDGLKIATVKNGIGLR